MKKFIDGVLYAMVFGIASVLVSTAAFATNGMNLEGYGPIATGMGGASMAYDNGTAAVMNNPATLSLMPEGNRLDVALGFLGPNVKASNDTESASSSANAFYMPAIGWAHKSGKATYGVGVFAQGGMGTEFGADSYLAHGSGEKVRTEVSVGRLSIPISYEVDEKLILAAAVDYVWAGMDVKMALSGGQFFDLMTTRTYGNASGSMVNTLGGAFQPNGNCGATPCLDAGQFMNSGWARFDFSDGSPFTGKAKSQGYGAKVGFVYKATSALTLGATYHSQTELSDMVANGAQLSMKVNGVATTNQDVVIPVSGKIRVKEFQWPQTIGAGMAYQASDKLLVVFDYKWINWEAVMKGLKMTFTADDDQGDPTATAFGLGGQQVDATIYQNWKNQNVFMIGAAYKTTPDLTLRAGLNIANNPIPDTYLLALFPAIEKNHVTVGAGYMLSKASSVDASFTYALEVKQTNEQGETVTHSQNNAQVMYSYRF